MFEKESKGYAKENCAIQKVGLCTFVDTERTAKIWKDGAEYGYNKANEWHYVKDGDLPELGVSCRVGVKAVYLNSYENIVPIECWFDGKDFVYWEDRKPVGWTKVSDFKGKVYAWKYDDELPELPKESKNG